MKSVSANPTAQEVLTHELRQPMTTTPAVPGRRNNRHRRSRRELIRRGWGWGTLMRHFLLSDSITALPLGVRVTSTQAGLIAVASGTHRLIAGLLGTLRGAVAMAAITRATDEYRRTTAGAKIASSWKVHWHNWPMGEFTGTSALWNTSRATLPIGAAGRDNGSGLAVGTGVAPAFPPAGQRSTSSPTPAPPSCHPFRMIPAALRLTDGALLCNPPAGSPSGSKP